MRAGFTLMELLVAMGLSAVVAVGLYSLSMVASQTFQQQQRISEMQLRLRNAMEVLRGDIQRAGYMATPASAADPSVCPRPAAPIQGVRLEQETSNPTHNAMDNVGINPVRLYLTGNYVNTDEYLVMGIQGNTVFLQHQTAAYNRCCANSATTFNQIFAPGRLVRLQGSNGQMQFNTVVAAQWQPSTGATYPSIRLQTPPVVINGTAGCGIPGLGVGATIAPITTVVYRIGNVAATQRNAYVGSAPFTTGKTDLVREEVQLTPAGIAPVPGTERIVAEYAVDFDVAAVFDNASNLPGQEPVINRYGFGDARNFTLLGLTGVGMSAPQRVRALVVRLSVRDRVQDPDFGWVRRNPGDPLTRFKVFPNQSGAARVRTATTEIELPNIAARNLR